MLNTKSDLFILVEKVLLCLASRHSYLHFQVAAELEESRTGELEWEDMSENMLWRKNIFSRLWPIGTHLYIFTDLQNFPSSLKRQGKTKGVKEVLEWECKLLLRESFEIRCAINFPQDIWVLLCLSLHIRCEITSVPFHLTTANRS